MTVILAAHSDGWLLDGWRTSELALVPRGEPR